MVVLSHGAKTTQKGDGKLQQNRQAWGRNELTLAKTEKIVAKKVNYFSALGFISF